MPTIEVNGGRINYRDAGSGKEAVLLLHAFPLHSGMWLPQIEALKSRYRVVAPDYRGLGRSAPGPGASTMEVVAGDVTALLQKLGLAKVAVVGLSMGGYVSFELYRRAPGLVRALVLCDTKAGADTPEGAWNREKFAQSAVEKGLGWVKDEMIPKLLRPSAPPEVVDKVRGLINEGTATGVAAAQRGMARRPDSSPTLARITCPTLVMVGADDTLTPPAESQKLVDAIPGSRLATIPAAAHISNLENPEAFNRELLGFLGSLPA